MSTMRLLVTGLLMVLAGCASHAPPTAQVSQYACEDGRSFQLHRAGDALAIAISGMYFPLQVSTGSQGERVYACNMLKMVQHGDLARVEMEGQPYLDGCRLTP